MAVTLRTPNQRKFTVCWFRLFPLPRVLFNFQKTKRKRQSGSSFYYPKFIRRDWFQRSEKKDLRFREMITRSKLVKQLRDYQTRSQNKCPALIFFSPTPHITS
ncbi:hypothetical protein CRYUN_Cryun22dG0110600 [Craigia yunnanensis]